MTAKTEQGEGLLKGARVYLSGPMDFVASRENEMRFGWRTRVGTLLRDLGAIVFDPWEKPEVRGLYEYGREGVDTTGTRDAWTFEDSPTGAEARARCSGKFWETLHIDLRMVDTSDFVIAYCPTNIYSVGTPHEIVMARLERKPVLFVSPPVKFAALKELQNHLAGDQKGTALLTALEKEVPIKPNPKGIPSLWYMPLVGGENFFDGFGFSTYRDKYGWEWGPMDQREEDHEPVKPLLKYLANLSDSVPDKWDNRTKSYVRNDDWLLWQLGEAAGPGSKVTGPHLRDSDS